jgi:hypothetical protein
MMFGMVGSNENDVDTIGKLRGAFWANNGNMDTHKERYLRPTAPPGLKAQTTLDVENPEKVWLDYEWDDVFYTYAGFNMKNGPDTLIAFLGDDWIAMDPIMENLVHEVVAEALHPVNLDYENIDSVEPLKDLSTISLAARLKFDQIAAEFGAEGLRYNGELGYNTKQGDSLAKVVRVIYDGRDTTLVIPKGKQINNLELCALKLHALERKLAYEFDKYYGSQFAFVTNVDDIIKYEGRKIVLLSFPEIIPNNPNQEPFQVTMVNIGFVRNLDWVPIITKKKDKTKGNTDKVTRRSGRDNFRDPVIGDEQD